jgi:uncharacterized protein YijF (DUF1287 family)
MVLGSSYTQQAAPPVVRGSMVEVNVTAPQLKRFPKGAIEQTTYTRIYDPSYVAMAYPGGDVLKRWPIIGHYRYQR